MSLVLSYVLYKGIRTSIRNRFSSQVSLEKRTKKLPIYLFLFVASWFVFEFSVGDGIIYGIIKDFPIIKSLSVNSRFASAFLFPGSVLGIYYINKEWKKCEEKSYIQFLLYFFLTLTTIWFYLFLPFETQQRNFNLKKVYSGYEKAIYGDELFIEEIRVIEEISVFENNVSTLLPYEPIFGYGLEKFQVVLREGDIYQISEDKFNMINPTSLVYDSEERFLRFSLNEESQLNQFANYYQFEWDIPLAQKICNQLSLVTMIVVLLYLFFSNLLYIYKSVND